MASLYLQCVGATIRFRLSGSSPSTVERILVSRVETGAVAAAGFNGAKYSSEKPSVRLR